MRKEIMIILAVKLTALLLIWWFFFAPRHEVEVTPSTVEKNFLQEYHPHK